jgi:DNA-binding transcriptional MerR regulator
VEKVRYMISDAANLIQVESHVLRYWEEELELEVPRNEMGHRYYTEENIRQFEQIKKLKEDGYQLKAIKMLVHNQNPDAKEESTAGMELKREIKAHTLPARAEASIEPVPQEERGLTKLEQFQLMMNDIVRNAIAENNQALGLAVSTQVEEKVIKEMNYLMRDREEQDEERFRKLDETIRSHQKSNRKEKTKAKASRKKNRRSKVRLLTKESIT